MKRFLLAFSITVLMVFATNSGATDALNSESPEYLLKLFPEMYEPAANDEQFASGGMSCLVETIGFDIYEANGCFADSPRPSTLAFFRIDGAPSNFRVLWSDSRCNPNRTICSVPIFPLRPVTMSATVLNLSNNTFFTASATARYEGFE